jgi:hypothetical protein
MLSTFRVLPVALALAIFVGCSRTSEPPKPPADAPPVTEAPEPDADGWYTIFNGKNLAGWKTSDDNPGTFQVVNGEIVVHGPVCHLYYDGPVSDHNFVNFQWKADILTKPGSNSGMYFHTKWQPDGFPHQGLEIQVNNTHADPIKTGSIYKAANIMNESPAKDDEWFTQMVIVQGRHIIVAINDKIVNDHVEPAKPEREAGWENNVVGSGTLALQGHDPESEVHYKNIKVRPLP